MNWSVLLALIWALLLGPGGSTPAVDRSGSAVGQASFRVGAAQARATFRVFGERAGLPTRGEMYYQETGRDGFIRFFRLQATQIGVFPDAVGMRIAVFSGPVTFSNDARWRGKFVIVSVLDGATPGGAGDLISVRASAVNPSRSRLSTLNRLQVWYPVQRGSLVVQ